MTRALDLLLSVFGLAVASPLLFVVFLVSWFDTGSPVFRQIRVGRWEKPFVLLKFRTMSVGAASVPTHLADARLVTRIGRFLRASKLDELPQLINVLRGDMSLVGPRPCLPSQLELIDERRSRGVFSFRPGITGLAQISGIDMSTPLVLAEIDAKMCRNLGLKIYLRMLVQTVLGSGGGDRIRF